MSLLRGVLALLVLLCAGPAFAHESLPLVLSVSEKAEGIYVVRWSLPPSIGAQAPPAVHIPGDCAEPVPGSGLYRCRTNPGGRYLSWSFVGDVPAIPTLVRFAWASGEVRTELAPPGTLQVPIPAPESAVSVSGQYLSMGIEHILTGYDHLLFLACILWIAGSFRRVVITVTGFTLAHSVTLALSALNLIHVPIPPTEAAIALSILFLAREIAIEDRSSLVWRHPALVSSLFGLLHGFGFASALREVGLPQTQLLNGLLFFNLGVELGQLMAIIAAVAAIAFMKRVLAGASASRPSEAARFTRLAAQLALVSVGTLSAFWFVERVAQF